MGFEPTIPVFERAKTVHALDRTTNVISPIIDLSDTILNYISRAKYDEISERWKRDVAGTPTQKQES
jgi:hypothetical protein